MEISYDKILSIYGFLSRSALQKFPFVLIYPLCNSLLGFNY